MTVPRTAAPATCSAAVERELLGPGRIEPMAAVRADELLLGRDGQRRHMVMPAVRTAVRSQAREHKPQAVEQLGAGAEGAADTRHAWPLVECDGGGNICYFIDLAPWEPASCAGAYRWTTPPDSAATLRRRAPRAPATICPIPTRQRCRRCRGAGIFTSTFLRLWTRAPRILISFGVFFISIKSRIKHTKVRNGK